MNPSADDIQRYKRFVRAAFFAHQAMAMSITHKVHLMWAHVATAMGVPGGLGKKREDWIEQGHQYGSTLRKQYRTTTNQEVRAKAIAGATHRDWDPRVVAKGNEVDRAAEYGPRVGYTNKETQKRLEREKNREKALAVWEDLNSHIIGATAGTVVAKLPAVGETRVVSWVRDAVAPEPLPPAVSHIPDLGEGRDDPTLTGPAVEL